MAGSEIVGPDCGWSGAHLPQSPHEHTHSHRRVSYHTHTHTKFTDLRARGPGASPHEHLLHDNLLRLYSHSLALVLAAPILGDLELVIQAEMLLLVVVDEGSLGAVRPTRHCAHKHAVNSIRPPCPRRAERWQRTHAARRLLPLAPREDDRDHLARIGRVRAKHLVHLEHRQRPS